MANHLQARLAYLAFDSLYDFPGQEDGVRGMVFIRAVVRSSKEEKWFKV